MSLEIVLGPMFSGKSTYALSYIRRQLAIDKKVIVIKPNIDNRYSHEEFLVTHNREKTPCMLWNVNNHLEVVESMSHADCIVVEEAQFFKGLPMFVYRLLVVEKKNILVVGLDGDASQQCFGDILKCIPWATNVTKLNALCSRCRDGTIAPYSKRINYYSSQQVDVGGADKYEAVCLKHLVDIQ